MGAGAVAGTLRELGPGDPREVSGYRLEARIGEGGMGTVYLSRTRGNRPLALKVIRREYAGDPQFRLRFAQEAQAARKVAGYHLVPVLDFDTDADQPWIASAYQPGLALETVLEDYGPLPMASAFQTAGCVARALQAVHAAGYVHRDVKPSNVLVGPDGPWVIDFGIARSADATGITVTGGIVGTPRFMSPEHARGRELGPASDVFSLGLLLAVAATGRHPYGNGSGLGIAALIAGTESAPPVLDGYPGPLGAVLSAALAAAPGDRPSAAELATMCEEALGATTAGRALTDFGGWLPPPVSAVVGRAAAEVAEIVRRPPRPAVVPAPAVPAPTLQAGFGPSPYTATVVNRPAAPSAARRGRALTAGFTAVAVAALVVAGTLVWHATTGPGDGTGTGAQGTVSPQPADGGGASQGNGREVPYAPPGYELLFANKPFTFAPPQRDDRANHLDLDVPQSTYLERGALLGPAELGYNTDGWLGSMRVVVGERKTVCTEEQQTAVLSHPLPAAELRLGRQVKVGTILCAITSNDNVAEAQITEIVPGKGADGLPTYKGFVTAWKRPGVDNPG